MNRLHSSVFIARQTCKNCEKLLRDVCLALMNLLILFCNGNEKPGSEAIEIIFPHVL